MENIDYYELFGVSREEDGQEAAASAQEVQGENEREVTDPAPEGVESGGQTGPQEEPQDGDGGEGSDTPGETAKTEQTRDERARNAARRRAMEEREAILAQARQEAQEEAKRLVDEAFSVSGLTNPFTKQPIKNKAEFDEYHARYSQELRSRMIQDGGVSPEEFDRFVDTLPEVRQAREVTRQARQEAARAREQQAKLNVEEQVRQINALDPSIKTLEDLTKMETYPQFYELVKEGINLERAYKLANFEALTEKAAAASRQKAINSTQSKSHLNQTAARGAGAEAVVVPQEVKDAYRAFNPRATDAEIQKHYNQYLKG